MILISIFESTSPLFFYYLNNYQIYKMFKKIALATTITSTSLGLYYIWGNLK